VADRVTLEGSPGGLVAGYLGQSADPTAFETSMQRRSGQMRDRRLRGIEAVVRRQQGVRARTTRLTSADSSGPIRASLTKVRLRHWATVLWFSHSVLLAL
jgi:hypothetical protein